MRFIKIFVLVLAFAFAWNYSFSATGKYGGAFLKLGIGARQIGMGESFVGLADDVNTLYWNPSGLMNLNKIEATAMYANWFAGINYGYLGYGQCVTQKDAIGAGIMYLNSGEIEAFSDQEDASGNPVSLGKFTATDMVIGVSYARNIIQTLNVGATLKILYADIGTKELGDKGASSFSVAGDLGVYYGLPFGLSFGLSFQNLGMSMGYKDKSLADPLPMLLRVGTAYKTKIGPGNMILGMEAYVPIVNDIKLNFGVEYLLMDIIAFRVGYRYNLGLNKLGPIAGLTAGLGAKYKDFQFDYAYVPYGDLTANNILWGTHRMSFIARFSNPALPATDPEELLNAGIQLYEQKMYKEAIRKLMNALDLDPKSVKARAYLEKSKKAFDEQGAGK